MKIWLLLVSCVLITRVTSTSHGVRPYGCNSTEEEALIQNLVDNGICRSLPRFRIQCRNPCTEEAVPNDECSQHPYCCMNRLTNTCVIKFAQITVTDSDSEIMRTNQAFVIEFEIRSVNITPTTPTTPTESGNETAEGRNFQLPGAGGFPVIPGVPGAGFGCPLPFPLNCQISPVLTFQLNANTIPPPVNIPYCQRIACNPANPFLEQNYQGCILQPGCFFDQQLFQLRRLVGQAIMPGVPVCHLAIRNRAFQTRANEAATALGGRWNPLLTTCVLTEYNSEIFGPNLGCQMILYLIHFGHLPKRAGWTNINERECALIGACWVRQTGSSPFCAYPVNSQGMPTIRSSNDESGRQLSSNTFGLPSCYPFDRNAKGAAFLSSYHNCLRAGCATSVSRNDVWQQLLDVSSAAKLPFPLNVRFISMVYSSQVRPDNYQNMLNQLSNPTICPAIPNFRIPSSINPFPILSNSLSGVGGRSGSVNTNVSRVFPIGIGGTNSLPFLNNLQPGTGGSIPLASGSTNLLISGGTTNPLIASLAGNLDPSILSQLALLGTTNNPSLFQLFPGVSLPISPAQFNPCPYQADQYNIPGLIQLTGSFVGCCDQPLCFLPRRNVAVTRSGDASYLYEWSQWSACSQSCNGGVQNRTRPCVGNNCRISALRTQTQVCNNHECPRWTNWGAWTACSATCGGGNTRRYRTCQGVGNCMPGSEEESETCRTGICPTFRQGEWSTCSNTCGVGIQTRTSICVSGGAYGCPARSQLDEHPCEQFCGNQECVRCCLGPCLQANGAQGHCQRKSFAPYCSHICRQFAFFYNCQS